MSKTNKLDSFTEPLLPDLNKKIHLMPESVLFDLMHKNLLTAKQQQSLLKPQEVFDGSNQRSQLPEELLKAMGSYYSASMLPMSVEKRLLQTRKGRSEQLKGYEKKQCNILCQHSIDEEFFKEDTNTAVLRNVDNAERPKFARYDFKIVSTKKIHLFWRPEHSNFACKYKGKVKRKLSSVDVILQTTNDKKYRNTILYAGEDMVYCHMHLLATHSQYFHEHKLCRQFRFPPAAVTSDILQLIYTWMLKGRVKINTIMFVHIFKVARYLRIPALITAMWKAIDRVVANDEFKAVFVYVCAANTQENLIRDAMIGRIHKTFIAFVGTNAFLELEADDLHRILESDALAVNSEMEILFAVARWLDHRWPSRLGHGLYLLECVRFRCMDMQYVCTLKMPTGNHVLDELLQWHSVQAMICDALFNNVAQSFGNTSETRLLEMFGRYASSPRKRLHAYNKYVSFHHNIACKLWEPISNELFEKYLYVLKDRAVVDITYITGATSYENFRCCSNLTKPRSELESRFKQRMLIHKKHDDGSKAYL